MLGIPLAVLVVYRVYSSRVVTADLFTTPRSVPGRLAPMLAGSGLILLALPVFAIAGWPLRGWALAAVLWAGRAGARIPTDAAPARCG